MLPRYLKNWSVFIDGRGLIGIAEEVELPKLAVKTEEYRGGGMDAPVELDLGMEKLECKLTIADYNADVIKLFGLLSANTQITLRGSYHRQGEGEIGGVIRLRGGIKEIDRDKWKAGDRSKLMLSASCNLYEEEINGEQVVKIDVQNMERIIGGIDQLEQTRANLGF